MEFSDFTIRLIIILIPGAIASLIVESLTIHKKWSHVRFVLSSIILGALSFGILQLLFWFIQIFFPDKYFVSYESLKIWTCIFEEKSNLNPLEILVCLPLSVFIGYVVSYILQKKFLFKVAKFFNVSSKFGDDSLYYYFLNSDVIDWVYIKDKEKGLTYKGQVLSFAEDDTNKEIVLRNVTVFKYENSYLLYSLDQIYLKFNARDVVIEIPHYNQTNTP